MAEIEVSTPPPETTTDDKNDDVQMTEASPQEGEQAGVEVVPAAPLKKHTLETIKLLNTARIQNGLRHNDYKRYREYCTRRLHRLRKSLRFLCGNKGRYIKRTIDPNLIHNPKFFLFPLVQAERAWAHAMELKEGSTNDSTRVRFHFTRKLKKATAHAELFLSLCTKRGCDRTALEAEAYYCWLSGTFALENEKWDYALQQLSRSRKIYEEIGKVGDADNREICKHKLEELDPSIKYCLYNLGSKSGSSESKQHDLIDFKSKGPGADLLNAKLEAVLAEARKKQATTLTEISWRGKVIPLKSEKLRVVFLSAQDALYELEREENVEVKIDLYDKLFICYSDAQRIILEELRADQSQQKSTKAETHLSNLQALQLYVSYLKLTKTIERNLLLVDSLQKRLKGREEVTPGEGHVKSSRPDELVRLFENLIQNMNDMEEIRSKEDVEQGKEIAANILTFKAFRCFYLAISYSDANKVDEAVALFDRASKYTSSAADHHKACASPQKADLEKLEVLVKKIKTEKCLAQVKSFMASLQVEAKQSTPNSSLLDDVDNYDASFLSKPIHLVDLPPDFEPISCRPLIFDLALSSLDFPSLEKRKGSTKVLNRILSFWRS
eukprot:TRINITY_DN222_c0_g3_i1.p1 TRINITY_DN222_c0_g3~~TRINITY_DN222_c0_g3_i1.p1  ORF type:complete len:674 (+),score=227.47 TRINITY_DN222_c0_g3_i1:191-2023(+)